MFQHVSAPLVGTPMEWHKVTDELSPEGVLDRCATRMRPTPSSKRNESIRVGATVWRTAAHDPALNCPSGYGRSSRRTMRPWTAERDGRLLRRGDRRTAGASASRTQTDGAGSAAALSHHQCGDSVADPEGCRIDLALLPKNGRTVRFRLDAIGSNWTSRSYQRFAGAPDGSTRRV